jgi:hypothetical protein
MACLRGSLEIDSAMAVCQDTGHDADDPTGGAGFHWPRLHLTAHPTQLIAHALQNSIDSKSTLLPTRPRFCSARPHR